MMVILVGFEVLGEGVDAMCEDRNLNFGRTGVTFVGLVLINELLLDFFLNHGYIHLSYIPVSFADTQPWVCGRLITVRGEAYIP